MLDQKKFYDLIYSAQRIQRMKTEMTMYNEPDQQEQIRHWNQCLEVVARTRDKASYMKFYDHFAPRLKSWLLGLTRDGALAEELVQETMLTVWRKAHLFNSEKAAASTWLFRVARNLHLDHLRKQQVKDKHQHYLVDEEPDEEEVSSDGVKIRDAIKRLPVQQAQVIYKSYFEGKSHQEISDELGVPLGSVKSSLRLAFQKLSVELRQKV